MNYLQWGTGASLWWNETLSGSEPNFLGVVETNMQCREAETRVVELAVKNMNMDIIWPLSDFKQRWNSGLS